jgi:RNA polymerase sigma factor (sigma-70 family)
MNKNLQKIFGQNKDSWIHKTPTEQSGIIIKNIEHFQKTLDSVLSTGITATIEAEIITNQNKNEIHLVSFFSEYDDENNICGVIVTGRDITEYKQLQRNLAEVEGKRVDLARTIQDVEQKNADLPSIKTLTPREKKVFYLTGKGRSYIEIARDMNISESTVNNHKNNIKEKLGIRNSTDFLHIATKFVFLNPVEPN